MPRLTTRDYLTIRHFLIDLWNENDGQAFGELPGYAQRDIHDYFAPTVPMSDRDALAHRKQMTKVFPSLPQKAGRDFEALRASLDGRPNQMVDRHRGKTTRAFKVGGKTRTIRVAAVSRPQIDTHYLAKALLQLVKEDDGTLMRKARRREARQDRRPR
ncbi:hypothetical protein ROT00_01180 [Agromyces mediolanus]|uniref:hypothetical protein n=1 Tax=Agromyces mediolanus TaxID=41986 RepID=UPI003835FF42